MTKKLLILACGFALSMAVSAQRSSHTLVAYFSATGNTHAVAQNIVSILGADSYRIAPLKPYPEDPYDVSMDIQAEAYGDLRPAVGNLPDKEVIAAYDTIFVGSPIWWHQPAMVVCTFLEAYDLTGKVIIPFFTYGSTSYLNESMQKIYKVTPSSQHIPATLPTDIDPSNIQTPTADDEGIDMPGRSVRSTREWLEKIGVLNNSTAIVQPTIDKGSLYAVYDLNGKKVGSSEALQGLQQGLYIIANKGESKKVFIK